MNVETALPTAPEATASGQPESADQLASQTANDGGHDNASDADGTNEGEGEKKPKPEKTEEQRRIDKLQRGIDRRTRREAEARAQLALANAEIERLRGSATSRENSSQQDDEPLTLSRAELEEMVNSRAKQLAPTLRQEAAEIEHRTKVIEGLAKNLGQERFDELAADLDENLGGLQRNGKPTAATEAIFAADDPQAVIEYLADPDNADEAEAIGRMDAVRAGRAIAKLEGKLEQSKREAKPQRSKAPEPVEPARATSGGNSSGPDTSKWTDEQWIKHHRSQRK